MKLYYFNPNNYGEQHFVMAENKTKAYEYLMAYLKGKLSNADDPIDKEGFKDDIDFWDSVKPLDAKSFPIKYTLDEYGIGEVIKSEIC